MAINKPHIYQPGIYFITFTNYHWLPLFDITNAYDLVYKWFDVLRTKGHEITGYVIMPNHVHLLLAYGGGCQPGESPDGRLAGNSLNTLIGNGKRFLAYDIVARLQDKRDEELLELLAAGVNKNERSKQKLHQVFEPSFDAKICLTQPFLIQKLDYLHNNPLRGKWMLAPDIISYPHSSALYYETGRQGMYPVKAWYELQEELWMHKVTYR